MLKIKCNIHSKHGSIMVIPREGGTVRLYIQVASRADGSGTFEKLAIVEKIQSTAMAIFQPYWIEWEHVEWHTVYNVSQGLADKYSLDERVFLGGDACHTHSPKAGQGMNTAFLDAQNLAWKIHHVESGFARREILKTYQSERRSVAEKLIDFDRKYAALFSQRLPEASKLQSVVSSIADSSVRADENPFIETFKSNCEFTSGYGVAYRANIFNWSSSHPAKSFLFDPRGSKVRPGDIMPNATVTRCCDGSVAHLEQEIPWNGSFRIYIFLGHPAITATAIRDLNAALAKPKSFLNIYSPCRTGDSNRSDEQQSPYPPYFSFAIVVAGVPRCELDMEQILPSGLGRYGHQVYLDNVQDKRVPKAKASAHAKMGLSAEAGGVVVVRPDGYVGCCVRLAEGTGTVEALDDYFAAFS